MVSTERHRRFIESGMNPANIENVRGYGAVGKPDVCIESWRGAFVMFACFDGILIQCGILHEMYLERAHFTLSAFLCRLNRLRMCVYRMKYKISQHFKPNFQHLFIEHVPQGPPCHAI